MNQTNSKETEFSTFREAVFKHRFVYEFLEYCWEKDEFNVEVLQNSIDNSGYDLIVLVNGKVNYIQLKVTAEDSKTPSFPIHSRLVDKERAFILLTEYDRLKIKISYYYLLKIERKAWELNKQSKREHVRQVKRTKLTGNRIGKGSRAWLMEDILSAFKAS